MNSKKETILSYIIKKTENTTIEFEFTTEFLAERLNMQRSNVSAILNQLVQELKLEKINGRPVIYKLSNYSLSNDRSSFGKLIGAENSLKTPIQLAKSAIMYPDKKIILLIGEKGCGSSLFASTIYNYAVEKGVLTNTSAYIKVNCSYYVDRMDKLKEILFSNENSILLQANNGVLFLDHIHLLSKEDHSIIFDLITATTNQYNILLVFSSLPFESTENHYLDKIPFKIKLPSFKQISLSERFEFVQQQLILEATKMNRKIQVDSVLLNALSLYLCEKNFKQLRSDIRIGCANGYTRCFNDAALNVVLKIEDFPSYVSKGVLINKKNSVQIQEIIYQDYIYSFSKDGIEKREDVDKKDKTIYEWVDNKAADLKNQGFQLNDIEAIIAEELKERIRKLTHDIEKNDISLESLSKVVDKKLIEFTDQFLKEASLRFKKVYPSSVFYGLSLHLSATVEQRVKRKRINQNIISEAKKHNDEYKFSLMFVEKLSEEFNIDIYSDEAALITMFITQKNDEENYLEHPSFLIAMHGESTATSVAEVVSVLTQSNRVYSYDLSLDKELELAYEELKALILQIGNSKGILMMFDMGSVRTMAESISKETKIPITFVVSPTTLLALECARKVMFHDDMNEIVEGIKETFENCYSYIMQHYHRTQMDNVIIALCMTGEGGAIQIKRYLDKNLDIENVEIIPLGMNNSKNLVDAVNHLRETKNIIYIIGAENPNLHNIPFISVSQLFSLSPNKLSLLLSIGGTEVKIKGKIEYARICNKIKEELPDLDIDIIKRLLPKIIDSIDEKYPLNDSQKIGMFMHIAGSINRLISGSPLLEFETNGEYIKNNKRIYNDLIDFVKPIEDHFEIKYQDQEFESLIRMIKKI